MHLVSTEHPRPRFVYSVFTSYPWQTLGLEAPAFVYGDTKRKPEGSARDKPSQRREGTGDHHECFGWLQKDLIYINLPGLCGLTAKDILFAGLETHESGGLGMNCG